MPVAPLRDVPTAAVELIKAFEGIPDGDPSSVNIDPYLCPADVWTIGWGHAITSEGAQLKGAANRARARALFPGGITKAQAELLLRADLVPRAAVVSRLAKGALNEGQFGALIALLFNIGEGNLAASTLLRLLNRGDFGGAAEQFLAWDKARVNGVLIALAGLTRRRKSERAMFLGQDWRAASAPAAAATRGRGPAFAVLPVPEAPEADRPKAPRKVAAKKAVKQVTKPAVKPAVKKAAKKAASGRTATPKTAVPVARKPAATKAVAKAAVPKKPSASKRAG